MAITKLSHVKERKSGNPNAGLYNCIDYILNPDKTEERYIGGNAGSTTQEVYNRMMATKQEFRKLDGRQCYHFIISFAPGETDAITCFNIAQDFCEKYLAGKYEYVFSVHTDHAHMHAHIVFNSVSLVDGVKYHYSDGQWKSNIQPITDQLCEKYGLKKLTYVPGKRKGVDYGTWREKKDPSGSQRLREAIDMAIAQSDSYDDFLSIMRKSYQVKIGFSQKWNSEYLSFKDFKTPAGRYRRNYVLGKSYTVASIQKRISLNKMEIPESLKRLPPHIRGFESSIGSGFRSANGLYLTQHQKRYMIQYWRLKNSERTSWQLRMISLFDQDPEDLVAMLEDSVKNSSVEIFQSIRKKYYIEKKSSADIEQIQKSMEQYVPLIHNQLDAYNEMSALLQQQFAVQQEKDDLHKSKGDLQERINAMQKEHEKISIEKEDIFHQLQDSEKEKISIQQQLVDATESLQKSQGTAASYEKQIAILNNRIDELEKQLEVYQAKENEIAQEEEKQLEQIPVKRRISWSSFFHDSKIKRKEELDIQEQAERERLAKEYIYDPSHSEEQAALFLDAAGTEEWTLEDLRTLAAQSDIDSMKILQRKIEQLHKASQKKNNK